MTYYAVIGGWILKYFIVFLTGASGDAAKDTYFTGFITNTSSVWFGLIFMFVTALIVYNGVEGGIERCSKFIMPVLLIMVVGIAVFSLTLKSKGADGVVRTGLDGLKVYLIPDVSGLTVSKFLQITLDAMSQLFFSLSVSMGIMITYGSYVKKEVDLNKSVAQIEVVDTAVAFLAGIMIIPAIYVFSGMEGMSAGPSLMFVALPKTFYAMGKAGYVIGLVFFLLTAFAALTSCISVLEAITANCMEIFHKTRQQMCIMVGIYSLVTAILICLGYNVLYFDLTLPNGTSAQLLDLMDYISNSFLMPFISLLTSILIGWIVGPKWITDEVVKNGESFPRAGLYSFMIRYVVPVIMLVLFLVSTGFMKLNF